MSTSNKRQRGADGPNSTTEKEITSTMADYRKPDAKTLQTLKDAANRLRIDSIKATSASKSGHPTSCCSAADVISVLFYNTMRYTLSEPRHPSSDRFVLSKGHAAPVLYAAWAQAGLFPREDLLNLRKIDSDLEGHPTPRLNFIDVGTGSLGQGLSVACGMAYTGKYWDKASYRVYCMLGDGESAEGSVWEAMAWGSHYNLDNLVAIFDVNRLGQSEPTALQHEMDTYRKRAEAFGWNTYVVDGHDVEALCKVLHEASSVKGKPSCIIAKTYKGKGIPGVEDEENFHGKPMGDRSDGAIKAIQGLIAGENNVGPQPMTDDAPKIDLTNIKMTQPPSYSLGDKVATRAAYGTGLAKLGQANDRVVAFDADVKNSTFSEKLKKAKPEQFVECFIAEQNMVGVGIGAATRDRAVVFCSTFACFLSRAYDQIRMAAISQSNVNLSGSHVGVSIGEDGPSQMALEDLAMFRAIPGSVVFYPSDAVSCERACELAANTKGICYIRTSRPATPVIYSNDEPFQVGKAKVVRKSDSDQVTIVGAAVTLLEATKAADELAKDGINVRLVDPFTIKPLDVDTLRASAEATGGRVLTVEDHYPEGGIGEAVSAGLSEFPNITVKKLAVREVPRSGPSAALLEMFGISASCIKKAVQEML
ncbi:transketolase-like [Branchiostoma lanceolatum]|uniref:transketolase-like n=1 Tax=Branchiostoma lanceolatum TaxID=7740 RepID=UPI00345314D5